MNYLNLKFKSFTSLFFLLLTLSRSNCQDTQNNDDIENILKKHNLTYITTKGVSFVLSKATSAFKPTIVFIRGSEFIPIVVNDHLIAFPFDIRKINKDYNIVVLPKPAIPVISDSLNNKFINKSFMQGYYLNNDGQVPIEFSKKNNLDYYVNTHSIVIDYLCKQSWINKDKIYVVGHSQGTHIASTLAIKNKKIKKVVLLSCNTSNRFYESVRKIRFKELIGQIPSESAQAEIDSIYKNYSNLIIHAKDNNGYFDSNTYFSYYSFTYPYLRDIIANINQPTLVSYGTNSIQDLDSDYLKFTLIEKKKDNVVIKPYLGMDHNFFKNEFDSNGRYVNKSFHWDDVIKDVLKWLD